MKRLRLGDRIREILQGHSQGLTLVEVLITIALIGAISVAFFSFMSAATSALIHADERTVAESLARSQLEYARNQGFNSTLVNGEARYSKIPSSTIPADYKVWSVNRNGTVVYGDVNYVIGIPWDSVSNEPATGDADLQMIALVIEHEGKVIYTFVNNNTNWAYGVNITLEDYIRKP